jgi:hypothetical protein
MSTQRVAFQHTTLNTMTKKWIRITWYFPFTMVRTVPSRQISKKLAWQSSWWPFIFARNNKYWFENHYKMSTLSSTNQANHAATAEKLRDKLKKLAQEEADIRDQLLGLGDDLPNVNTTQSSVDLGDCIHRHLSSIQVYFIFLNDLPLCFN